MRNFDELTPRGKARRLRILALDALRHYPFEVATIQLVGMFTNTLFRIKTTDNHTYVIRICAPNWRTEEDLRSEAMWLHALGQETDIGAPQPILARNGDLFVTGHAPMLIPCRCLVTTWIPGRPLGQHLTETNLYRMGQLFARLHDFSAHFTPGNGFTQRKVDKVLARGEPEVLFSESTQPAFSAPNRAVFEQIATQVTAAYDRLYADPAGLRVIHHDLHHDNIHLYRGRLYPLDFEDTVWGYPVQDIAMAMQDLMIAVQPERFDPLLDQFRAGYTTIAPWPEQYDSEMDTFRAGRMLWVTNYVALHERQHLEGHINWITPLFERFLETSKLRIPAAN